MGTRAFWVDLAERSLSTFAAALIPILAADGVNLLSLDWRSALGLAGTAAVLSACKSIAATRVGDRGTASLVSTGRHVK